MTTVSLTATSGDMIVLLPWDTQVVLTTIGGDNQIFFSSNDTEMQVRGAGQDNRYYGSIGADIVTFSNVGTVYGHFSDIETVLGNGLGEFRLDTPGQWTVGGVASLRGLFNQSVQLTGDNTVQVTDIDTILGGGIEWVELGAASTISAAGIDTLVGSTGADNVTLLQAQTGAMVNLLGGGDALMLADGRNDISAFNIETVIGGSGLDSVTLGGSLADPVVVGAVETLVGTASDTSVMLTGAATMTVSGIDSLFGSEADEHITLAAPVSGMTVHLVDGDDLLRLADGGNLLSAYSVDTLLGGSGFDTVYADAGCGCDSILTVSSIESLVNVDPGSGGAVALGGAATTMTMVGFDSLVGTSAAEHVTVREVSLLWASGIDTLIGDPDDTAALLLAEPAANVTVGGFAAIAGTSDADRIQLTGDNTVSLFDIDTVIGTASSDAIYLDCGARVTVHEIDTVIGCMDDQMVTISGGGSLAAIEIDTILGSTAVDMVALVGGHSGVMVNLLGGGDSLVLDDGGNNVSAFNVETIIGGGDDDAVTIGGNGGNTVTVTALETITGNGDPTLVRLGDSSTVTVASLSTLLGSAGADWVTMAQAETGAVINLFEGNDRLQLGDGGAVVSAYNVETIIGGDGFDRVTIGGAFGNTVQVANVESLIAGSTQEMVTLSGASEIVVAGLDTLIGSAAADRVFLSGDNTLTAWKIDTLIGTTAADRVTLGDPGGTTMLVAGLDTLIGSSVADQITLSDASTLLATDVDTLVGSGGLDQVTLTGAGQTMSASGIETLVGTTGADSITLLQAQTSGIINLLAGADRLVLTGPANDLSAFNVETITGGPGADRVAVDGMSVQSFQVSGIETLIDLSGPGLVSFSGAATTTLVDFETVLGDAELQRVTFSTPTTALVSGIETLIGSGSDRVTIGDADNTMTVAGVESVLGGSGRTYLNLSGPGSLTVANVDTVIGSTSEDIVRVSGAAQLTVGGVEVLIGNPEANSVVVTGGGTLTISGIESVLGSASADRINISDSGTFTLAAIDTLHGELADEWVNIVTPGSMVIDNIDTLVGSSDSDFWTVTLEPEGGIINPLGGPDMVVLTNQRNILSAFNVETLIGGTGLDTVNVGGHYGSTTLIAGVETITGNSTMEYVRLSGPGTVLMGGIDTLVGSTDPDHLTLMATAENTTLLSQIDTIVGSATAEWVNYSGGGTVTVSGVETLVGDHQPGIVEAVTLATAQTGILVNLLSGNDTLVLADGGNRISAYNIETIVGGAGADLVELGGAHGVTSDVSNVETVIGTSTTDTINISGGGSLVIGGGGADRINLQAWAGVDQIGFRSQIEGGAFGDTFGGNRIANFQSGIDKARIMAGSLLESAVDKGAPGLSLVSRGGGQVNLSTDEVVYLTQGVQPGRLVGPGFADLLVALGPVAGSGPTLVFANDGTSSGLFYLNDFGTGTITADNVRLLGLFNGTILQTGDIALN